jgi:hypothetical protein
MNGKAKPTLCRRGVWWKTASGRWAEASWDAGSGGLWWDWHVGQGRTTEARVLGRGQLPPQTQATSSQATEKTPKVERM